MLWWWKMIETQWAIKMFLRYYTNNIKYTIYFHSDFIIGLTAFTHSTWTLTPFPYKRNPITLSFSCMAWTFAGYIDNVSRGHIQVRRFTFYKKIVLFLGFSGNREPPYHWSRMKHWKYLLHKPQALWHRFRTHPRFKQLRLFAYVLQWVEMLLQSERETI